MLLISDSALLTLSVTGGCRKTTLYCFLNARLQIPSSLAGKIKNRLTKVNLFFMVRVTGLEPVRRETHAPQTCLSAYSSTLANIVC